MRRDEMRPEAKRPEKEFFTTPFVCDNGEILLK
jgi:hypothetical protein